MKSSLRVDTGLHPFADESFSSGWLQTDLLHRIYYEEVGNRDGIPVLVIHGGPGGEIRPYYKRLIDKERCRGVFFDQRGCGRSLPFGSLDENNTWALVSDMEQLRKHLSIDQWLLLGGSWGSALALAYAQTYPERVTALVISGVFLCRQEDVDWWWEGARTIFPEVFAARDEFLDPDERSNPRLSFHKRILDGDSSTSFSTSLMLSEVEGQTLDLWPSLQPDPSEEEKVKMAAYARILCWFDQNRFFLEEGQLLKDAYKLADIPGAIIAGRSDICTPPKGAWDLSREWGAANLTIVAAAGHRWSDELLGSAISREVERLITRIF
ncbi:prolyl aminopeptidase [Blastomonas marina]|uniref:prolyl aminopeptidase n=1 Tax=Blastomonas marina TaxID=1867408 RepID=UPI002AC94F92|nr:prolyl aminopeptidase [Blastomonas marina]WPZ02630.1 prolyl aminopeptidase [Blastomonas marina]